ncbi:MAG TPA: UDP-N-acetylglucosamine--LPS N-acetylglucosamine transferase [Rikenellaceae bacterium]|nr:UDP-N-acetylglucosamine--LPS N-acetylglucosamine transferase [Rikenellaceae bacterium]
MVCLKEFWRSKNHFWVSFPTQDALYLLMKEKAYWAYYPTNRNIINLFKNFGLAWRILRNERPSLLITTGAGVAVPFIFIGKLLRIKTIYLESITRNEEISLSGRLIYPVVDVFLVQWQELAEKHKKAVYKGQVI